MKAAVQNRYGPPEVLRIRDVPTPKPRKKEVLVKVHAAGVNRTDCANLRARPFIMRFVNGLWKPRKKIPGTCFAGVVVQVGSKVKYCNSGDRVFGFDDSGLGAFAEYLCFPENKAMGRIPEDISFVQAAASIEGAHYALNFLNKVTITEGCRVLVNGGSGAIGSAAIQLLRVNNAHITAVCGTGQVALVKKLGADEVIDYLKEDFTRSGLKFDFVFDTVGKSSFGKCRRLLNPKGAYISSELGRNAQNLLLALVTPIFRGRVVRFPIPLNPQGSIERVRELMAKGSFQAHIDHSYSLNEIVQAFHYVETGKKIGNVVIEFKK